MVELVMVMLLIGIVSAITVIPRLLSPDPFEQRGAYDEVVAAARYAQKLAITNRCTARLTLNPTRFTITQSNTTAVCGTGADALAVPHPTQCRNVAAGTNYDCNTSAGVTISLLAGTSPVTFDSLGRTTDLTSRTVQVGTRTFTIVGASGFVQVPP